jgi:hypothetical protein
LNGWSNWEIHGGVNDYLEIKNAGTNPNKYVNLDNLSVGAQTTLGESSFYSNTTKPAIYTTCGSSANVIFSGQYGGTPIFVFNRHGNVLMGAKTAQGQVSISGTMNSTPVMTIIEGANTTDILQLKDTSNNVGWVVDTDFNQGIGTSSPSAKLHVVGDITGHAISGASFHGDHFVSSPYDIGNTNGTVTIDFDNGSTQLATLNGNVTAFAASNPAAGESVTVQFKTTAARTISPGSTLAFIGDHPTGLSANMTGVLSLMSFDGSTVMAGFATQTGVG